MKKLLYFCFLALCIVACDEFDSWTTSQNAMLSFSEDTISFDTIITNQSSTTKTLIASNKNSSGIRISKVELGQGNASHFRVNVDGQYLYNGAGEDFEVRGKDSIYIRAEVMLPDGDTDEIQHFEDKLIFTLENGKSQQIILQADGMDVIILRAPIIETDTTFSNNRPIVIYDSLVVSSGATLTLAEGTTLMFHDDVSMFVHGTLKAKGSLDNPVVFRGDRVDRMFDYLPYDNTPNRWGGIHICEDSKDNEFYQCDIHSGDYGIICDSTDMKEYSIIMENSIIHNVGGAGLYLKNCKSYVSGTEISNCLNQCLYILGGNHQFVHCTIAQFYPWSANRGDALYLANKDGDMFYNLDNCAFANCVITGYADDVIMGTVDGTTDYTCSYFFTNSLLRTIVGDDDTFVDIKYDTKDSLDITGSEHFVLFDTKNILYDFTPDSLSAIRGLADKDIAAAFPIDRKGNSRLADGAPDAGAYEGK